ncbi:glycosyltransferase family 20-domain-containing protein [Lipomyces japonicus]|uniref:glycosyltransferase family 20-domain-containing protein n=1 Tax=Lipomyces japonicus TaxID=56871 RepID=UPI0034CF174A
MPTDALELTTKHAIAHVLANNNNSSSNNNGNSDSSESDSDDIDEYADVEVPVFASDSTVEGHYTHYCKEILWPTFHYQIPDNPKSKAYEDHSWVHYHALNQAVADAVVANYEDGDTVWVHDYHLLLVPGMVRRKLPNATIGFFLHIAFPSSEVFRCLPTRKLLLQGMLGADVIGFQTVEYARHFRQSCQVVLGLRANPDGTIVVDHDGRTVSVVNMAIGIDAESIKTACQDSEVVRWRQLIRERWGPHQKLVVGRDKLDEFRGVKNKLLAYERFLKIHPEYKEKATMIQVCLTNIASQDLESEVSDIVTRINSSNSHVGAEPPVVFLHQDILFEQYLALLCEADVFVVTSLREGMNLTCHEYVICQAAPETSKGPLVLSEFTGSASVLSSTSSLSEPNGNKSGSAASNSSAADTCVLVNPWDTVEVAHAFFTALTMPDNERDRRWRNLYAEVVVNTGAHWVNLFLSRLADAAAPGRD